MRAGDPADLAASMSQRRKAARLGNRLTALFLLCAFVFASLPSVTSHAAGALSVPSRVGGASCPGDTITLYLPGSRHDPLNALYLLLEGWLPWPGAKILSHRMPGRGGSYALSRLIEPGSRECSIAAMPYPSFYFLSASRDSLFREKDIRPLVVFASSPNMLWVRADSPVQDLSGFLEMQYKKHAETGQPMLIAGAGSYTDQHLATLQFVRASGIPGQYLPLLGALEATDAVRRGKSDACWGYALPASMMPGLKPLAVASAERIAAYPQVQTFTETSLPVVNTAYFALGIAAGSGIARLGDSLSGFLGSRAIQEKIAQMGFTPVSPNSLRLQEFTQEQEKNSHAFLNDYPLVPAQLRR